MTTVLERLDRIETDVLRLQQELDEIRATVAGPEVRGSLPRRRPRRSGRPRRRAPASAGTGARRSRRFRRCPSGSGTTCRLSCRGWSGRPGRRARARTRGRRRHAARRRLLLRAGREQRLDRPGGTRPARRRRLRPRLRRRRARCTPATGACTLRSRPSAPGSQAATRRCSSRQRATSSCRPLGALVVAAAIAASASPSRSSGRPRSWRGLGLIGAMCVPAVALLDDDRDGDGNELRRARLPRRGRRGDPSALGQAAPRRGSRQRCRSCWHSSSTRASPPAHAFSPSPRSSGSCTSAPA